MDLNKPLTPLELRRFGSFLEGSDEGMSLPTALGFLTAIGSAPTMFMPSQWIPALWGDPVFDSLEQGQEMNVLLMRVYNHVLDGLSEDQVRPPLHEFDDHQISSWCSGYIRGLRMDREWLDDEYAVASTFPFAVLAGEFDLTGEEDSEGNVIEDPTSHEDRYRRELPDTVVEIHAYWIDKIPTPEPPPSRRPAKPRVGRNERCPCGSGRKYKQCCL